MTAFLKQREPGETTTSARGPPRPHVPPCTVESSCSFLPGRPEQRQTTFNFKRRSHLVAPSPLPHLAQIVNKRYPTTAYISPGASRFHEAFPTQPPSAYLNLAISAAHNSRTLTHLYLPHTICTMADVATAPNANQQVPLDTIPISPAGDNNSSGESKGPSDNSTSEGEIRTVFHDAENFNVKHPLMNTWTLWFTKPPSGKARCSPTRRFNPS